MIPVVEYSALISRPFRTPRVALIDVDSANGSRNWASRYLTFLSRLRPRFERFEVRSRVVRAARYQNLRSPRQLPVLGFLSACTIARVDAVRPLKSCLPRYARKSASQKWRVPPINGADVPPARFALRTRFFSPYSNLSFRSRTHRSSAKRRAGYVVGSIAAGCFAIFKVLNARITFSYPNDL